MTALRIATSVGAVESLSGEQFKARRAAIGMSVAALAKRAGVDRGSLTALEDGRTVRDKPEGPLPPMGGLVRFRAPDVGALA